MSGVGSGEIIVGTEYRAYHGTSLISKYCNFTSLLNQSQPYSLLLELYHFLLNIFRQKHLDIQGYT